MTKWYPVLMKASVEDLQMKLQEAEEKNYELNEGTLSPIKAAGNENVRHWKALY
jgi:hypothetical protein